MDPANSKILVVDDEPELRELLVFDFENLGYIVKEAENAFSALAQLDKNPDIKVVVSDIKMPDGDGITLLREIQARKVKEPISLIFVTGFTGLRVEEAFNLGAHGYMTKPFDRRVLSALVKRFLLPGPERWTKANNSLPSERAKFHLNLESFDQAIDKHLLSIGLGGMFVATDDMSLPVGTVLDFEIDFKTGEPAKFFGQGVVRWIRSVSTEKLLAGLGVEFLCLTDEVKNFILTKGIISPKEIAFIPIC